MALERILQKIGRSAGILAASLALSCHSCDEDKVGEADYCAVRENFSKQEICNNNFDDNCNNLSDEGCDEDGDGYCAYNSILAYIPGVQPIVCKKSYENCISSSNCNEGIYECVVGSGTVKNQNSNNNSSLGGQSLTNRRSIPLTEYNNCPSFLLDCDNQNKAVNPGAMEVCNGINDNCQGGIDEIFPEYNTECQDKTKGLVLGRTSICQTGRYSACIEGKLICTGEILPMEEKCSIYDEDCDGMVNQDGVLTEARPCYYNEEQQLPLDDPTVYPEQVGTCQKGVELCINGEVGGDNICHGSVLPQQECCDCLDNSCGAGIDEGVRGYDLLQIGVAVDMSNSMDDEIGYIQTAYSSIEALPCSTEVLQASTVSLGETSNPSEPRLKRARVSLAEFMEKFAEDIPNANGSGREPNLNGIAYAACTILDQPPQQPNSYCDLIRPYNTLDGSNPIFTLGAKHALFVLTDEPGQWVNPNFNDPTFPILNQQEVAELALAAEMDVTIFTEPAFNTLDLSMIFGLQGYGYFEQLGIGTIEDIHAPDLAGKLEQRIFKTYCPNGDPCNNT